MFFVKFLLFLMISCLFLQMWRKASNVVPVLLLTALTIVEADNCGTVLYHFDQTPTDWALTHVCLLQGKFGFVSLHVCHLFICFSQLLVLCVCLLVFVFIYLFYYSILFVCFMLYLFSHLLFLFVTVPVVYLLTC